MAAILRRRESDVTLASRHPTSAPTESTLKTLNESVTSSPALPVALTPQPSPNTSGGGASFHVPFPARPPPTEPLHGLFPHCALVVGFSLPAILLYPAALVPEATSAGGTNPWAVLAEAADGAVDGADGFDGAAGGTVQRPRTLTSKRKVSGSAVAATGADASDAAKVRPGSRSSRGSSQPRALPRR